jgi:hypothetical protein
VLLPSPVGGVADRAGSDDLEEGHLASPCGLNGGGRIGGAA